MVRTALPKKTTILGFEAENIALAYLEACGLILVERNFHCRFGELDLIMRTDEMLIFIEVRSRRTARYGTPAESVTLSKQRKLLNAAAVYLQLKQIQLPCRFDVVAITKTNNQSHIEWIKNAFQLN